MWWLTSKAVKMESQDLISSKDLLLWNKPSQNNSTIYLTDLLMILQSGPFNSAPHGTGWGSSTTATGLRVEVWLTALTPQLGWLTGSRLMGFLSLHLSLIIQQSSLGFFTRQPDPKRAGKALQSLLRSKPVSHVTTLSAHSTGQSMSRG